MDYLERQSDIFVRWALKNEKTLMTLAKVKSSLHNTQLSLGDIDLLVKHLEHSGRIVVEKLSQASGDVTDD